MDLGERGATERTDEHSNHGQTNGPTGEYSDTPILCFLHPVGTSGRIWAPVVRELGSRYHVMTLDLPGHGETPLQQQPFRLEDAAHWVSSQLSQAGGNVVLIGHSIGGMIAQMVAASRPTWLKGIVLVSTMSRPPSDAVRSAILERATMARKVGMEGMLQPTLERWFTKQSLDARADIVDLTSRLLLASDPEVHAQAWEAIANLNTVDLLPNIQASTLVVVGEEDVSTPPALSRAIVERCPSARMEIIRGAGHALPLETTEEFVKLLGQFIHSVGVPVQVDSVVEQTVDRPHDKNPTP